MAASEHNDRTSAKQCQSCFNFRRSQLKIDGHRHGRARDRDDRQSCLWATWKRDRDAGLTVESSVTQTRCDATKVIPQLAVRERLEPSRNHSWRIWVKFGLP